MYLTIGLALVLAAGFFTRPAPVSQSERTEFRSELDGFSLRYPDGWKVLRREELAKYQGVFVFAAEQKKTESVFGIRVQPGRAKDVKLDEVATALDKALPGSFADFNKLSQEKMTLNGQKALKYDYVFTAQDKTKVREQLVIVAAPKRVYHLAAWSSRANFSKVSGDFERIVNSFSAD